MAEVTDPLPVGRGTDRELRVTAHQCAEYTVVALSGDLDVVEAGRAGELVAAAAVRVPRLIVDLAGLTFSDCAGMHALASAAWHARQAGGDLVLAAPGRQVLRLLSLTGMTASVRVYPSVEAAAGVASPQRAGGLAPDRARRPS